MSREALLTSLLTEAFRPEHLRVENESHNHSVPKGSETHFKVVIVSTAFEGKATVARHQMVYALTNPEMKRGLHALSIVAKTPIEWAKSSEVPASPLCASKTEARAAEPLTPNELGVKRP